MNQRSQTERLARYLTNPMTADIADWKLPHEIVVSTKGTDYYRLLSDRHNVAAINFRIAELASEEADEPSIDDLVTSDRATSEARALLFASKVAMDRMIHRFPESFEQELQQTKWHAIAANLPSQRHNGIDLHRDTVVASI